MFVVLALCFLAAPWYQQDLLQVNASLGAFFTVLDLAALAPLLIGAAVLTGVGRWQDATQAVQTAALSAVLLSTLFLHHAALRKELAFPTEVLGLQLIAIAYFGGFTWVRIALAAVVCLGVRTSLEFSTQGAGPAVTLSIVMRLFEALVAILGAWSHERLSRLTWIRRQITNRLLRTDALTGLASRFEFERSFVQVLRLAARDRAVVGVMLADVDRFKSINDQHGHLVGDHVLRSVGQVIGHRCTRRPMDLRARYGGEEIVLVWYGVQPVELQRMAEDILQSVRDLHLVSPLTGERIRVTISAGLTWIQSGESAEPEALLRKADALMYQAKNGGRDRLCCRPFASDG